MILNKTAPFFQFLGYSLLRFILELGHITIFFTSSFIRLFQYPFQFTKWMQQTYFIGVKSISVVCLTALFTGMVLGLQGYYTLVKFGSEGLLGSAVALSLIRELGPVLTAIMIIGRAGSSMAAEMGIMRISDQIDALYTMDINPKRFLISPKIGASILSFPLLTAIFDVVGIMGGYLTGVILLGINPALYIKGMESSVVMTDVTGGFIKSIVFSIIVSTICLYQGYYTHRRADGFGAKGVSNATTDAVVMSCVIVLIADYVLTSLLL
ncbi:MAG: ABC transporter permease [Candidatus Magnetomorum sp.]|nr:ABC transporter permease [Candidatus Magnetomorum sp.]